MKKQHFLSRIICLLLTFYVSISIFGCTTERVTQEIDETKTQLFVSAYDAGYGQEWLNTYKKNFEEFYKDYSFEEGKKGVEVIIDWNQSNGQNLLALMEGSVNQVYFNVCDYFDLVSSGKALDLTDILKENLTEFGESDKNVFGKIPEDLRNYLQAVKKDRIFAVPSTDTWDGISYNIDLFENEDYGGFYFASEYTDSTPVFTTGLEGAKEKAKGPDNIKGTYDDGLPATISQFYQLLDRMVSRGVIPFTFTASLGYAEMLPKALFVNFEGKEQMQLNFTFNGVAKDLINVDNGVVSNVGNTVIDNDNAYMLMKQQGIYQALDVIETLVHNEKSYFSSKAFSGDQNHIAAQEEYLYSEIFSSMGGNEKPIAFLVEGTYWQAEASGIFESIAGKYGEAGKYSVNNRRFGYMPLPFYDESRVGEKQCCVSGSLNCFAKANQTETELEVTKKFIQFINTDEQIFEYVKVAGFVRGVEMNFTEEQKAQLTPYARSLIAFMENADMLHAVSTNKLWIENTTSITNYATNRNGWLFVMNESNQSPVRNMYNNSVLTAENFFNGMYNYMQGRWNTLRK